MSEVKKFTDEIDEYVVLTLKLDDYTSGDRTLSDGYEFLGAESDRSQFRQMEETLLRLYFRAWYKPFFGKLPGFRSDSAVFVARDGHLVAGVYLCDSNELGREGWGQLHYNRRHGR